MKTFKLLAVAAAVAVATISAATAQTPVVVRITGSTAFRTQTNLAIQQVLQAGYTSAYNGTSATGASRAIYKGNLISGGTLVTIKTSFGGSVGGIEAVVTGNTASYLPDNHPTSTTPIQNAPSAGFPEVNEVPQVTMSDSFQSSTPFTSVTLEQRIVGIVAFGWAVSTGAPAGVTNITSNQAQAIYGGVGYIPLAQFTGLATDRTATFPSTWGNKPQNFGGDHPRLIFGIGRNNDSGTRVIAFAESGIGVTSTVSQFNPTIPTTGAVNTVSDQVLFGTTDGFSSGGTLADVLRRTTVAGIGGWYVGYMGTSDLARATSTTSATFAGPARALSFNGVFFSKDAVTEGKYTFWSYQHLLTNPNATQSVKNVASTLATQITQITSEIQLNEMRVARPTDGGVVLPTYL